MLTAASMAADYRSPSYTPSQPKTEGRRVVIAFGHPSSQVRNRNIVNVTVELSSFGRPKKEKLDPHLRPLREATAPTVNQVNQQSIIANERPVTFASTLEDIHRRQRGHGREAKRIFHIRVWPNRAGEALLDPREELLWLFGVIWRFSGVLVALSLRGRCMERGRCRAIASLGILCEGREFYLDLIAWMECQKDIYVDFD
ncbi:hypothetical protein Taro_028292 [Colocasia esculenta]|uniref:Uncharacterized protein n=1 Tax=Colocasia esculenta TaxID=4460 RepID=A0A843VMQ6_COLES|nr:hypothetical protein [Colocasia esculenta]